jgi:hypothetical protein
MKLKNDKASGMDNLINEYLKETIDIISAPITTLFNAVFNSGYFPTQWTKGVIIPVHKKGPSDDPNNYRGITLASSLGKLFTSVLNERLKHWSIANNIGTDAQYGFKPKYSTVDAIFVLQSLINERIQQKKKLYCALTT